MKVIQLHPVPRYFGNDLRVKDDLEYFKEVNERAKQLGAIDIIIVNNHQWVDSQGQDFYFALIKYEFESTDNIAKGELK